MTDSTPTQPPVIPTEAFDQLEQAYADGGTAETLATLADVLQEQHRYHEWFEVLKMQIRHRLGLPLLYRSTDDGEMELDEPTQAALEQGLIDACRQVGHRLLEAGRMRDAWMYLRPLDERQAMIDKLRSTDPTDENIDEMIELCLHEQLDIRRGFQLILQHYGTCNCITTFDSSMYGKPRSQRAIGAELLLDQLYAELVENVLGHIEQQEGTRPAADSLACLIANRPWLFSDGTYHVDTTHLSSVVRIARDLQEPAQWRRAWELTQYGLRLDDPLRYPGDPPFEDFYPRHAAYFQTLLGENVAQNLRPFREAAEAVDLHMDNSVVIEVYLDLLARTGRLDEAIAETIRLLPPGSQTVGLAPNLLELCQQAKQYDALRSVCRERAELFGFALALLQANDQQASV